MHDNESKADMPVKYYIITTLIALIAAPIALSFILGIVALVLIWYFYTAKMQLPQKASQLFAPVFFAFSYYMLLWVVFFGLSNFQFDDGIWELFRVLAMPYFTVPILRVLFTNSNFPAFNFFLLILNCLFIAIGCWSHKKPIYFHKITPSYIWVAISVCLCCIAIYQTNQRNNQRNLRIMPTLPVNERAERIEETDIDLSIFHPFSGNNQLVQMQEPPTIIFTDNFPVLDGATAAYPVFAAMAQALYAGLDEYTIASYVSVSTTDVAYERLINGEIDIFFGAQPSRQQREMAALQGVQFELTPIGREAFVFIVHKDNPVDSLTVAQIRDIYKRRILNWRDVGGDDMPIMPFQRPANSGSQTIMEMVVMDNEPMWAPLQEEFREPRPYYMVNPMANMITHIATATYRNYYQSIGYTFRYFATVMNPNENIKLLAIDGIYPSIENIRSGAYPFTVNVYAVTAGTTNENADKLIEWILSEQGQDFIELGGYIRIQ